MRQVVEALAVVAIVDVAVLAWAYWLGWRRGGGI